MTGARPIKGDCMDKYKKGRRIHWRHWVVGEVYFLEGGTSPFILVDKPTCASWNTRDERNVVQLYLTGARASTTKTYLFEAILEEENNMAKLYEFFLDGTKVYGSKLAKDSAGNWVMEVKGQGQVVSVPAGSVEEVMPYTIGVNFESNGQTYSYTYEKDLAKVGDLFVIDAPSGRAIVQVVGVDTKSRAATKEFKPLGKLKLDT